MATIDTRIQVRLDESELTWLTDRSERMHTGSHHQQARLELGMWRTALNAELRRIRLTLNQANCIADVLNSQMLQPHIAGSVGLVRAEVEDAFQLAREVPLSRGLSSERSSYGAKWGIDEQALLDYLRTLGPTADHALLDAVNRWWADENSESTVTGWAAVGLRVRPDAEPQPERAEDSADNDGDNTGTSK